MKNKLLRSIVLFMTYLCYYQWRDLVNKISDICVRISPSATGTGKVVLVLYTRREFEEIICRIVDDASKRAEGLVLSSASSFRSSESGISVKLIIKTLNRLQTLSDPAFQIWGISTVGFPRVFEDLDERRRRRCVKSLGEVLRNYAASRIGGKNRINLPKCQDLSHRLHTFFMRAYKRNRRISFFTAAMN